MDEAVPLLLLDVDGVLNAVQAYGQATAWPAYERTTATADGVSWPIAWAPGVVARVNAWAREGRAEVRWLTTWEHDAPGDLAPRLGLDAFAVAGGHEDDEAHGWRWWKEGVARALVADGRPLVWLDDDLDVEDGARTWAAGRPATLALAPDPAQGLSPADLDRVEQFLADPRGGGGARLAPGAGRAADPRYDVGPRRAS